MQTRNREAALNQLIYCLVAKAGAVVALPGKAGGEKKGGGSGSDDGRMASFWILMGGRFQKLFELTRLFKISSTLLKVGIVWA